ncbi:MAG TPA: hypothetical protein VF101_02730 [Gaiellaceae bacterium]
MRVLSARLDGGNPEQQALLREILRGIPRSQIKEVALTTPPEDFEPADAAWIAFEVAASDQAETVRGFWQALVVAGLFRDESASRGLPFVAGKTITVRAPDGSVLDEGQSLIDQPTSHAVPSTPEAQVSKLIANGSASARVAVARVSFGHPLGQVGVEATVTTAEPSAFVGERQLRLGQLLAGCLKPDQAVAEGFYIEVRDRSGKLVTTSAYSVRTGEGVGFTDPSYASSTGFGTILH